MSLSSGNPNIREVQRAGAKAQSQRKQLTPREKNWVKVYMQTGNATEATAQSYNTKNRTVAREFAKQIKRRPIIQLAIAQAEIKHGLDPDYVVGQLKQNIDAAGVKATAADSNKAIDIWARIHKLYTIPLPEKDLRQTLQFLPQQKLIEELKKRELRINQLLQDIESTQQYH